MKPDKFIVGDFMSIKYEKLGKRIREIRNQESITQEKLAEKLNKTSNYISNIERGKSKPSLETIIDICNALNVTTDQVLADSVYAAKDVLNDDIARLIKKCTHEDTMLILSLIEAVVREREENYKA